MCAWDRTGAWNSGGGTAQDATLTALAGLTITDVSIVEGVGPDAFNVVAAGGSNRLLGSNSDNTALEFKSSITGITIGGFTANHIPQIDGSGNLTGAASASWGGIILGDSTPDAAGEFGYDSGKFSFYGANSEDIYIEPGNVSNTTKIGSNTGITKIATTLGFASTGVISGKINVISKAAAYTLGTDSTDELYGCMTIATTAMTLTLPNVDAASGTGQSVCMYSTTASVIRVNPNDADKIRLSGTLGASGVDIYSAGAAGNFICLMVTDFATDVAHWTTLGSQGTWAVGT